MATVDSARWLIAGGLVPIWSKDIWLFVKFTNCVHACRGIGPKLELELCNHRDDVIWSVYIRSALRNVIKIVGNGLIPITPA